ncbi:unnamed protein product [Caenorhabditis auriculariae]|uniref:Serine/threonine-protein phosphatase n=1 Tax=Caenorhabditis auriculariae TaxID=2777116 RepID=A0A8S1GWW1_9PELO|nr:unnamed protein product [Caenorhabditis auriculariae]
MTAVVQKNSKHRISDSKDVKDGKVGKEKNSKEDASLDERPVREKDYTACSEAENKVFVEKMILNILSCKGLSKQLSSNEILRLLFLGKRLFISQARMVEIEAPVRICGDTHGQYGDLIRLFHKGGFPPKSNYLFLGDYVDRGRHSLEVILLLLCYKLRFERNIFLLRGNHECAHINFAYGFRDEIGHRKPRDACVIYNEFKEMFNVMPLTAIVGSRILCMHGGLSPRLNTLDDLRKMPSPTEAATDSLEMDILWADPMNDQTGFKPSLRGASVSFGPDVVSKICKDFDLDLIVRAHQVVQDGFEFFANRRLVTIFSAPHYCGQFDNSGSMCVVSEGLEVSFDILRPAKIEAQLPRGVTPK